MCAHMHKQKCALGYDVPKHDLELMINRHVNRKEENGKSQKERKRSQHSDSPHLSQKQKSRHVKHIINVKILQH